MKMNERLEQKLTCAICRDIYKVPVKVNIYHSCYDKNFFCMRCAYLYFEFVKENRKDKYKCPFCNGCEVEVELSNIEKDECIMFTIDGLIAKGQVSELVCSCGQVYREGEEMHRHLQEECEDFFEKCKECKMIYLRKEEHKCMLDSCIKCEKCMINWSREDKMKHMGLCFKNVMGESGKLKDEIGEMTRSFEELRNQLILLGNDLMIKKEEYKSANHLIKTLGNLMLIMDEKN